MEDLKAVVHSECEGMEAKPSECVKNDIPFLTDEKFDFDLSLSPMSENEDEVFLGPMGHKEKCIAVLLESQEGLKDKTSPPALDKAWSPLAGEKFVEIFKEAHLVALQLQSAGKTKRKNAGQQEEAKSGTVEKFVQESKSKLKILERGIVTNKTPTSIKRETFYVGESPVSQLPSSLQKCSSHPARVTEGSHCPQRLLNASSPGKLDKLPKTSVMHLSQSKSDKSIKTPSTFQPVKNASGNNNSVTKGQPKQGKLSSSFSRNNPNSMGSSEDLLSEKSSIASNGESPFCNSSSAQENQTLPTPSKLSAKTRQLKPPSNVRMRNITSSSSSSSVSSINSSLNSSLSLSPKTGKVHTSGIATKAFANRSSLSSTPSKTSAVRSIKMSLGQTSHMDTSGNIQKSTSATKGNLSFSAPKYKAAAAKCETSGSGIQKGDSNPSKKLAQKSMLGNLKANSSPKLKTKAMSSVSKEDMSAKSVAARVLQPVKLLSCSNAESNVAVTPPLKRSEEGSMSKSCSAATSALRTPASSVRHSSLPTPVGRRISGIPMLTPKTQPRLMSSPNPEFLHQLSKMSSKKPQVPSTKLEKDSKVSTSSSSSAEESSTISQIEPIALVFSPEKSSEELEQDETKKEEPAEESLLVDIGLDKTPIGVDKIVIQRCESKPLIDIFNTPEVIKAAAPVKPTGQLIDLSSPLIQLGPEGNKENIDSPLLKF